ATIPVSPPALLLEDPSPQPFAGAAWNAGYWEWRADLSRYEWVRGRWVAPPSANLIWVPPRWQSTPQGWVRVAGRWIAGPVFDRYGRQVWHDSLGRPHYI